MGLAYLGCQGVWWQTRMHVLCSWICFRGLHAFRMGMLLECSFWTPGILKTSKSSSVIWRYLMVLIMGVWVCSDQRITGTCVYRCMQVYVCAHLWKPEANLRCSSSGPSAFLESHWDMDLAEKRVPGIYLPLPPSTIITSGHHYALKKVVTWLLGPNQGLMLTQQAFANWTISTVSFNSCTRIPDSSTCQTARVLIPPGKASCLGPSSSAFAKKGRPRIQSLVVSF